MLLHGKYLKYVYVINICNNPNIKISSSKCENFTKQHVAYIVNT